MTQLLLTVAGVTIVGLLSPGPNFVLISGRAMSSGRRPAIACAIGVAAGSLTHAIAGIAGVGALLRSSAELFLVAKTLGAVYLVWIGVKSLRSAIRAPRSNDLDRTSCEVTGRDRVVAPRRSALDGYLTQMSNPKSTLFFLALFTTVVPAGTGPWEGAAVVATVVVLALLGYLAVAVLFSQSVFQRGHHRLGHVFDGVFGALMVALGLRVGLSRG